MPVTRNDPRAIVATHPCDECLTEVDALAGDDEQTPRRDPLLVPEREQLWQGTRIRYLVCESCCAEQRGVNCRRCRKQRGNRDENESCLLNQRIGKEPARRNSEYDLVELEYPSGAKIVVVTSATWT